MTGAAAGIAVIATTVRIAVLSAIVGAAAVALIEGLVLGWEPVRAGPGAGPSPMRMRSPPGAPAAFGRVVCRRIVSPLGEYIK